MVHEHKRHHGFGNRRRSDTDTWIMTPVGLDSHRLALLIDGSAGHTDARCRLNPDRDDDILPGGNPAQNAACMIRHKTIGSQFVAMLRPALDD